MRKEKGGRVVVAKCAADKCGQPIYKGDSAWKFGAYLCCNIRCLSDFMREVR